MLFAAIAVVKGRQPARAGHIVRDLRSGLQANLAHDDARIIEIERRAAILNVQRINAPGTVRQIARITRVLNPHVTHDALRHARHVQRGVAVTGLEVTVADLDSR